MAQGIRRRLVVLALLTTGLALAQPSAPAVAFMDGVAVTDDERHKLYHGNAERLFHIAPMRAAFDNRR